MSPGHSGHLGDVFLAYALRAAATIRWTVAPCSVPEMPLTDDPLPESAARNDWNTPGAIN